MGYIKSIKCYLNYHEWEMINWIMPYRKECNFCKKKMQFIGYSIWIED